MANAFVNGTKVATLALATLRDVTVLPGLVYRDASLDFPGGQGDTVTIRKPATFAANVYNRANGITIQDINETSVSVTLDTLLDVSTSITSEQLTLNVVDLRAQVVQPAMEAIATRAEATLISKLSSVTNSVTAAANADYYNAVIDAKVALDTNKVPQQNRVLVLDPVSAGKLLKSDKGSKADVRGDQGQALTEAYIARIGGFDVYVLSALPANTSYAFHRDAFALVSRALALPVGGAAKGSETFEGQAIRWAFDYDIKYKQDVLSFDVLVGAKVLDATRAVKIVAS